MDLTLFLFATVVIVTVSLGASVVWVVSRRPAPKRRPQASAELPALDSRASEGISWTTSHRARSKNNPPSVTVKADFSLAAPISFKVESAMDRFGKAIGLANEFQTNDPAFDEAIYIDTPYPDFAAAMLGDGDNRRAIRRCFAASPQLTHLKCRPDGCQLVFSPAEPSDVPESLIRELLAALPGLRQSTSRVQLVRSAFREKVGQWVIALAVTVSVLSFIPFAIGLIAFESLDPGIYPPGILLGLVAALGLAGLAFLVLRGRSGALLPFILALSLGLVSLPVMGIGGLLIANGVLDKADPLSHQVMVSQRYVSHGKNSTSYHIQFVPWREGLSGDLSVSYETYQSLAPGSSLTIRSSAGGLGFERLIGLE